MKSVVLLRPPKLPRTDRYNAHTQTYKKYACYLARIDFDRRCECHAVGLLHSHHQSATLPCSGVHSTCIRLVDTLFSRTEVWTRRAHRVQGYEKLTSMTTAGECLNPKHIMYLDCYDNKVTQPLDHIVSTSEGMGTELLIAGEEHCWPDPTHVWCRYVQAACIT